MSVRGIRCDLKKFMAEMHELATRRRNEIDRNNRLLNAIQFTKYQFKIVNMIKPHIDAMKHRMNEAAKVGQCYVMFSPAELGVDQSCVYDCTGEIKNIAPRTVAQVLAKYFGVKNTQVYGTDLSPSFRICF